MDCYLIPLGNNICAGDLHLGIDLINALKLVNFDTLLLKNIESLPVKKDLPDVEPHKQDKEVRLRQLIIIWIS